MSRKASSPARRSASPEAALSTAVSARAAAASIWAARAVDRPGEPVERGLLRLPRPLGQRRLGLERRDERRLARLERADPARDLVREIRTPALPSATLPSFAAMASAMTSAASRAAAMAKRAPITAWTSPPATSSASRVASAGRAAAGAARRPAAPRPTPVATPVSARAGRGAAPGTRSAAFTQTASAPSAPCSAASSADARAVDAEGVAGAAEVARGDPEGVVEGLDAPDRPGDEAAEGAERLGLAAEPARIADHLVADEPGRDQVGERRRGGIGGWDIQDEPLDALGDAGGVWEMSRDPSVRRRG